MTTRNSWRFVADLVHFHKDTHDASAGADEAEEEQAKTKAKTGGNQGGMVDGHAHAQSDMGVELVGDTDVALKDNGIRFEDEEAELEGLMAAAANIS